MANSDVRLSERGLRVLRMLVEQPSKGTSGAEIAKATGVSSGTLYPLLARLEAAGWLKSQWENVEPGAVGRPRRRLYKLTAIGQRRSHDALSGVGVKLGKPAWAI